jgi:3-oxoacyl-[acyl-carrier protein] reductase
LTGTFNMTRELAPHMVARGGGTILNASSIVGVYGNFGQTNYVATKAGVIGMTRVWARELGRKGVRVNCVAPGFIATDMTAAMKPEILDEMKKHTPLGRLGAPEDVARAYVFLASEEASFINGQVLGVDGGLVAGT